MADHMRVVVYVRAEDARLLKGQDVDPGAWVRAVVVWAFEQRRAGVKPTQLPESLKVGAHE